MSIDTWIFDLDDTLYAADSGLNTAIETRMTDWIAETLRFPRAEADRLRVNYWRDYGGTLPGLVARHGIDPDAFLAASHDIPLDMLAADPALASGLAALPGRRVIFTNGPALHAERVLEARGIATLFDAVHTIEDGAYIAKPDARAYRAAFDALEVDPARAAMFEDSPANLKIPHEMGMVTVLVGPHATHVPWIDHRAPDLAGFLSQLDAGRFPTGPRPYLRAMTDTDIFVSGAGIAGMILAALLARRGWRVTVCDPKVPAEAQDEDGSDMRSTAYLAPSVAVLEEAGLWEHLLPDATPLEALRVMDSAGTPPRQTALRTFRPVDLDLEAFGWNVMNWRAHRTLMDALTGAEGVDLRLGTGFADLVTREDRAFVTLTDGTRLTAKLVVGADGRTSPVREALGIDARLHRYGQKALAFACTHAEPHERISTEIYHSGGAMVTVPLHDHGGRPASSIVWMDEGPRITELAGMEDADFNAALAERALGCLGPMERITPLRPWPIITQTASRLTGRRAVLAAEAAHVLPPIGAQGLNTSIADISVLADSLGTDPGAPEGLAAYERSRSRDMHARAAAIDAYNRLCRSGSAPIQRLRAEGLKLVNDIAPLRRRIMMAGMGGTGSARDAAPR